MKSQSGRAEHLLALSHETSAETRRALIDQIAKQFRDRSAAAMRENQELGEGLVKVLPSLDLSERVQLARALAPLKEAPTFVVRELARDEESVAGPVLAASRLLVDDDLLAAMRRGGEGRLCAIAQRPGLSQPLQAAIVKTGARTAILTLAQNPSFDPSADLLGNLIVRARSDEALANALARRRQMPTAALADLFFSLKSQERAELTYAVAKTTKPSAPAKSNAEGEAALLRAVRSSDRKELLRAFDSYWKLGESSAHRILRDATCESLAVLCLGLGISRATYSTLAILMRPDSGEGAGKILGQFDRFSPDGARSIAHEWAKSPALPASPRLPVTNQVPPPGPRMPLAAAKPTTPAQNENEPRRMKVFGRILPTKPKANDETVDAPPSTFGVTVGGGKSSGI